MSFSGRSRSASAAGRLMWWRKAPRECPSTFWERVGATVSRLRCQGCGGESRCLRGHDVPVHWRASEIGGGREQVGHDGERAPHLPAFVGIRRRSEPGEADEIQGSSLARFGNARRVGCWRIEGVRRPSARTRVHPNEGYFGARALS